MQVCTRSEFVRKEQAKFPLFSLCTLTTIETTVSVIMWADSTMDEYAFGQKVLSKKKREEEKGKIRGRDKCSLEMGIEPQ